MSDFINKVNELKKYATEISQALNKFEELNLTIETINELNKKTTELKNNYEQLALLSYYYSLFVNNQTNTTDPYYEKLFKDLATKYQGLNSEGYILFHEFLSKFDTMKNSLKDFAPGFINQTIYLLLDRLNNTNLTKKEFK